MNNASSGDDNVYAINERAKVQLESLVTGRSLKKPSGSGTSGGMSDDWKISVENQLSQLHGDVRNLLFGLIAGFLVLAGSGWTLYLKTSDQLTAIQVEQAKAGAKLESFDAKLDAIIAAQQTAQSTK